MRLVVTGGLGFIGSCFIRKYCHEHQIVCIDKMDYAANPKAVEEVKDQFKLNVFDLCEWPEYEILDVKPDWVIHFAAQSHVDNSIKAPYSLIYNNIISTANVLEVCRKHALPLLLVSTDEVFGEGEFTEETPYHPNNPYSASKASGDMIASAYHHTFNTNVIITHSCNNYGEWQHQEKFIPTIVRSIKEGKPVPIYGTGLHIRDWIYAGDHCSAIMYLINHGTFGEHYCIGAKNPLTNIELVKRIFELAPGCNPTYKFVQDRLGHDLKYTINPEKLYKLGWHPETSFNDALKRTIDFYLE